MMIYWRSQLSLLPLTEQQGAFVGCICEKADYLAQDNLLIHATSSDTLMT